jgi:DNA-directed RNA polymerase subunit beta
MQSLALDIQVVSEEGGPLEVAEEEDDLLRAAEELGIDLSARYRAEERATEAQAALVPSPDGADVDGELDEDGAGAGEFEGAPELETHEIEMDGDSEGVEMPSFADDGE